MAQNYAFLPYGATQPFTVTGNGGINTVSIATTPTTGLPATAGRIWNAGTALAFISFGTATTLTVTGAAANGIPVPQSVAPYVLRTGGATQLQFGSTSTFTTTILYTAGEGID